MPDESFHTFIPSISDDLNLTALSFAKETTPTTTKQTMDTFYSLYLIIGGEGILDTPQGAFPLYRGALLLKIPNHPYRIENVWDLQYFYVSFTGTQADAFLDRIHYRDTMPVWDGFEDLIPLWEKTAEIKGAGIDLAVNGIILYSFSYICSSHEEAIISKNYKDYSKRMLHVRQYIDCHYTEPTLDLKQVSDIFSYNYKYLSHEFKDTFGVGFAQYLNDLRLASAGRLIDRGIYSVKEIAVQSGFSDTLYFSKLFRQHFGLPPRDYIKEAKNRSTEEPPHHPASDENGGTPS